MDHPKQYPSDLSPGHALTAESVARVHAAVITAYAQDPEHRATLATAPWAPAALLSHAQQAVTHAQEPLYDFDLAYNYWNWLYQVALYGQDHALHWDRLETMVYPCLDEPALNNFCLNQGLAFIENSAELIEKWQPVLPAVLNQLEHSGVRVICNHATWMSQGILIILFHHALRRYCEGSVERRAQVQRLGLYDPIEMGTKINTLLGPWITTLGKKLNPAISDLNAMAGVQAMSNVVKVFPDTPSGRFMSCERRWQGAVRNALKHLRHLESTPGTLIFETPSGQQDDQRGGMLIPAAMPKAAVRLSRSRPNQVLLVGMDERAIFDTGICEGGFKGGIMGVGKVGFALQSCIGPRPEGSAADWPFDSWTQMEPAVAALIENPAGDKIGRVQSR